MIALEDLIQNIGITKNLKWTEALYLRKWEMTVFPTKAQMGNIVMVAEKLQAIRDYFNSPVTITSWLRPLKYNTFIKGATDSAHLYGMAVDFNVVGHSAEEVRKELIPQLETMKIRMENITGDWVHIDIRKPGPEGRFFEP